MSVWNNIAKTLGFGGDAPESEEESWQVDDVVESTPQPEETGPVEIEPARVHAIFQRVIEVFNNTLPDFLSKSVDPEKQRKYLYDSLDASTKNYLAEVQQRVNDYCTSQWQAERDRLKDEAARLRKRTEELEEKKSAMADKQLSTDRQKRALSERVRDLEDQILKLEAEKEQLDIENKCMVNKAKAATVLEEEIEELRKENLRLNDARQAMDMRSDLNDAMGSEFKKQAAEATAEMKALNEKLQALTEEAALKDARIADLTRKAQVSESKIAELTEHNQSQKKEIDGMAKALAEAQSHAEAVDITPEQLEEIQHQISRFEEVKKKLDSRIDKLRATLKESQAENQSLRDTIKENLLTAAKTQQQLNERIEALTRQLEGAKPGQTAKASEKKRNETKRSSSGSGSSSGVDQLINGADWLVSSPAEESPMHSADEDSFGYTAPPRKPRLATDNDAQLSLFDM